MKKLTLILIGTFLFLLCYASISMAIGHSVSNNPDRSIDAVFYISAEETQRTVNQFGYSYTLADYVAKNILRDLGIPSSFTAKISLVPGYVALVMKASHDIYTISARNPSYRETGWTLSYRYYPQQLRAIDNTLGKFGDKIMPFGEGAKIIIGTVNDILNTVSSASR